jgi:Ca2+-binding EF-hand superfamily protein
MFIEWFPCIENQRYRRLKTYSAVQFFKLADTDGDGLISYREYMLFLALMLSKGISFLDIQF